MPLMTVIGTFVVVAVILGLVNWIAYKFPQFINTTLIQVLNVIVIVVMVVWVLALFFPLGHISQIRVGR
jgi:hypothetical protein